MDFVIEFENPNVSEIKVIVYNMQGKEVFAEDLVNFSGYFKQDISLQHYTEGVYIVNITSDIGSFYTHRVFYIK